MQFLLFLVFGQTDYATHTSWYKIYFHRADRNEFQGKVGGKKYIDRPVVFSCTGKRLSNSDSYVGSLGDFSTITATSSLGRDGTNERQIRSGLQLNFQ